MSDWVTRPDGTLEVVSILHRGSPLWGDATHLVRQGNTLVPAIIHDDGRIERWKQTGRPSDPGASTP